LHQLIAGLQRAEQAAQDATLRHDGEVGRWIANGATGKRPTPAQELDDAQRNLARAAEDGRAARHMLPQAEAAVAEAAALVGQLTQRREVALTDAVLEAIADHLDTHYLPHMQAARSAEKACWDVIDALQPSDPPMAQRIAELIRARKSRLAIPTAEPHRGAAFIAALLRDPSAQLGFDQ
jgi:hypothetical protein